MKAMAVYAVMLAPILLSHPVQTRADGADVGDTCQRNSDCDTSAGQHCIRNVCTIPGNNGAANGSQPPPQKQASHCPGLAPGYSLTCRLFNGQVYNVCGVPGAVPAPVGSACQIYGQPGVAIQQQ